MATEEETTKLTEETKPSTYSELEVAAGKVPEKVKADVVEIGKMVDDLRIARSNAKSAGEFGASCFAICCGSVFCSIVSLLLSVLPLVMLIIGILYMDRCKADEMIPIWLVVFGAIGLFSSAMNLAKSITQSMTDVNTADSREGFLMAANIISSILSFFLFIWILAGSIWVFGFYSEFNANECKSHGDDPECCHPVPYYFSLVILFTLYTFGALSLILLCVGFWGCVCACCK